jgi:hypothetical protein
MSELVLTMFKSKEVDMGKLTRRSIKRINALKLDNVVRGKHTAKQWSKYING